MLDMVDLNGGRARTIFASLFKNSAAHLLTFEKSITGKFKMTNSYYSKMGKKTVILA